MDAWRGYVRRAAAIGIGVVLLLCGAQAAVSQNTVELEQELAKARDTIAKQQAELGECQTAITKLKAENKENAEFQKALRWEVEHLRGQLKAANEQQLMILQKHAALVKCLRENATQTCDILDNAIHHPESTPIQIARLVPSPPPKVEGLDARHAVRGHRRNQHWRR